MINAKQFEGVLPVFTESRRKHNKYARISSIRFNEALSNHGGNHCLAKTDHISEE